MRPIDVFVLDTLLVGGALRRVTGSPFGARGDHRRLRGVRSKFDSCFDVPSRY